MNSYKVIVLGASGSGKTVFLASMYKQLSIQRKDSPFFLDIDPEQQRILVQKYREIASKAAVWPAATKRDEVSEWRFTCRIQSPNDSHIYSALQFTYLDYAGERLTDPQGGDFQTDFDAKIREADALLGILDGQKILSLMKNEPDGDDFINTDLAVILQDMQRSQNPVHFVITKWDLLHNNRYTLDQVRKRLLEASDFLEFVQNRTKNLTVRLIPVSSVGMDFAVLQPNGSMQKVPGHQPKPFQVEMPLVCVLPDQFKAQIDALKERQAKMLGQSSSYMISRSIAEIFGVVAGSAVRFLRGFLLGAYQFTDVVIERLLNFVELSAEKRREQAEQLQREREVTLKSVQNEETAFDHAIISYLVLVRQLERDFPESVL